MLIKEHKKLSTYCICLFNQCIDSMKVVRNTINLHLVQVKYKFWICMENILFKTKIKSWPSTWLLFNFFTIHMANVDFINHPHDYCWFFNLMISIYLFRGDIILLNIRSFGYSIFYGVLSLLCVLDKSH